MKIDKTSWKTDIAGRFDAETNRSARVSAALGYWFFFIPFIMHPESKFARYHANQGLIVLLMMTLGVGLVALVPYAGPMLMLLCMAFGLVCMVRGTIVALRCQAKHIPLLGKLILIDYDYSYALHS